MALVACLIADLTDGPLDDRLVASAARDLGGEPRWLAEGEAAEIHTVLNRSVAQVRLEALILERRVDAPVILAAGRRKRLLVSDMDSTMITIECIDELADYAGIKPEVAAITRRAMNGEIEFRQALIERVALLAGLPAATIEAICRERLHPMPGATTLLRTMRASGARCVLVSGGFRQFTSYARDLIGFDLDEANRLEVRDGRLTGRLEGEIHDPQSKLEALRRHAAEVGIGSEEVLAVGDGANDLPMLGAAGLGVAFRAHPGVQGIAPTNIRYADLTALLYLQGYRRDEILRD